MRWGSLLAFACALGLASACGDSNDDPFQGGDAGQAGETGQGDAGDGNTPGGGGTGSVALDALPAELARVFCDVISTCFGTFTEIIPQPECEPNLENQFRNGDFFVLEDAVEAGRVTYDGARVPACLRSFEALGCDVLSQRNADVCEEAVTGTVPLGEACSIDAECEGAAFCAVADACPGVCAAPRGVGETCASDGECESGLNCDAELCAARATAGEACGGPDAPECQIGLFCTGATDTAPGTCAQTSTLTSRQAGEDCDAMALELCEPGLSCVFAGLMLLTPSYVCRAKSASGDACRRGFPEPCPDGEYCEDALPLDDSDGLCVPLPGVGDTCLAADNRPLRCEVGLVCANEVCATRKGNGGSCSEAVECYSERCTNGRCEGPEFCTAD